MSAEALPPRRSELPIRMVLALLGMDQHEVGAMAAARVMRTAGIEVIYLGRFQLPAHVVTAAIQEDADLIGISVHSWEYLHYLDELIEMIPSSGRHISVVVGGSVLTRTDVEMLLKKGVAAVFSASSSPDEIVNTLVAISNKREVGK